MTTPAGDIELSDIDFTKLCAIVHENTGITIAGGRKSMLVSRLRGRLRETNERNFKSYIARVTTDAAEMQELIDRVTTNKTYFFRTPRVWDHFRTVAVSQFQSRKTNRAMRIWSAAASTGAEACTIGIVLEDAKKSDNRLEYSVLGTDVSSRVLETAEAGLYSGSAVKEFCEQRPELFNAYMTGNDGTGYKVSPTIRARIKYKRHNLLDGLKNTSPFDAIILRNVLIYFTPEDQEKILRNIHESLAPNGVLYIGESESLNRLETDFEMEEPMIYRPMSRASGMLQ